MDRPHRHQRHRLAADAPTLELLMSTWGNNKPDRKHEAGKGGSGWLRSPQGYRVVRFNAEQLWQNLIRQGWERVPPQW